MPPTNAPKTKTAPRTLAEILADLPSPLKDPEVIALSNRRQELDTELSQVVREQIELENQIHGIPVKAHRTAEETEAHRLVNGEDPNTAVREAATRTHAEVSQRRAVLARASELMGEKITQAQAAAASRLNDDARAVAAPFVRAVLFKTLDAYRASRDLAEIRNRLSGSGFLDPIGPVPVPRDPFLPGFITPGENGIYSVADIIRKAHEAGIIDEAEAAEWRAKFPRPV